MDIKTLTTKEVARLCRVSDATVKRWECAGLIKSERTNGGHRRFRVEEIASFRRQHRQGFRVSHSDESAALAASRRRVDNSLSPCPFFHSIIGGCETEAADFLINLYLQGKSLTKLFDDVLSKALCRIGELWYKGELTITQEHLATRTAFHAVSRLRGVLPVTEKNNKLAICCAPEGDLHELPPSLVQITLEDAGFEVLNFGANTPLFCLAEEVSQFSPALICVSATIIENLERTAREFKELQTQISKTNIPIIIGGRAFSDKQVVGRFSADYYPKTFSQLSAIVKLIGKG